LAARLRSAASPTERIIPFQREFDAELDENTEIPPRPRSPAVPLRLVISAFAQYASTASTPLDPGRMTSFASVFRGCREIQSDLTTSKKADYLIPVLPIRIFLCAAFGFEL